jgi:hypothetical protein
MPPAGRLCIIYNTPAGRTTLTAGSRTEAENLPPWQHDFFRPGSKGIAIGFSGETTAPPIAQITSELARGRVKWPLANADFVLIPTETESANACILTSKFSQDAAVARIHAALSPRTHIIESTGGYKDWMRYGHLPASDQRA